MGQNLLFFLKRKSGFRGLLDLFPNSAAAYSLQPLSKNTLNSPLVRVRRGSDNGELDFTGKQISDGTMLDWVNEDVVTYESDFSVDQNGWNLLRLAFDAGSSIGGEDNALKLTRSTSTGTSRIRLDQFQIDNDYTIDFKIYIPSSNVEVDGIRVEQGPGVIQDLVEVDQDVWLSYSIPRTATNIALEFKCLAGTDTNMTDTSGNDVFYIKDITITQLTANGFIRTWYDQSGLLRHAQQATALNQPLIVENGVMVRDNLGNPSIKTTSDTSRLFLNFSCPITGPWTFANVAKSDIVNVGSQYIFNEANQVLNLVGYLSTSLHVMRGDSNVSFSAAPITTNTQLRFGVFNGVDSIFRIDQQGVTGNAGNSNTTNMQIGGQADSTRWRGVVSELIIWPGILEPTKIESDLIGRYNL